MAGQLSGVAKVRYVLLEDYNVALQESHNNIAEGRLFASTGIYVILGAMKSVS